MQNLSGSYMVSAEIYRATIRVVNTADREVKVFRGVICAKIVYDALSSVGLSDVDRLPPFKLVPPKFLPRKMKRGYEFEFSLYLWQDAERILQKLLEGLQNVRGFVPVQVKIDKQVFEPVQLTAEENDAYALSVVGTFWETVFRFFGHFVPYPSPLRTTFSALKNYSHLFGVDAKSVADAIQGELVRADYVPGTYPVHTNPLDVLKGFRGQGQFLFISDDLGALEVLYNALMLSNLVGVGFNRRLGFGTVKFAPAEPLTKLPKKISVVRAP